MRDFAGTYHNPGYGLLTLCATTERIGPCAAVLDDYAACTGPLMDDALYASWPRLWSTHVALVRLNDTAHFTFQPQALFPRGYGNNKTAFATIADEAAHAEFGLSVAGASKAWELFGRRELSESA
jgi:hypothetical protein